MMKLQVSYIATSKAKRMFYFFKPYEIVQGEKLDLKLTFDNVGSTFHGGFFQLQFWYPGGLTDSQGNVTIPPIDENQSASVMIKDIIIHFSGTCGLLFTHQHYHDVDGTKDSKYLWDLNNHRLGETEDFIPINISSKEELYQKYSVIVAIWVSIISIIISTLSIVS